MKFNDLIALYQRLFIVRVGQSNSMTHAEYTGDSNIGSSPIMPYLERKVQFHRQFATEEAVSRKPIMVLEEVSGSVEYPLMTGNVG